MQAAQLKRHREELREIRTRLVDAMRTIGDAVPEDVQASGDLSHIPTHAADRDSEGIDAKIALGNLEGALLRQVDAALGRIENGTFGQCETCAGQIPDERLQAVPYTPYCVNCEAQREQDGTLG